MTRYFYQAMADPSLFTSRKDCARSSPDKLDHVIEVSQRVYARMGGLDDLGLPVEDETDEFGM